MPLDNLTDEIIKEENASSEAIRSLITVKKTGKAQDSDVELKTDLTADEVKGHTIISIISKFLEMDENQFKTTCILSELIAKKERKAWSKDRQSRKEIVEVSRQPDFPSDFGQNIKKEGFIRKLFTPRQ